jgi:peptide-methionine (S)-S-oxide reductase
MKFSIFLFCLSITAICSACNSTSIQRNSEVAQKPSSNVVVNDTAYFASGCFWCVEAIFECTKGVGDVVSGYCGGHVLNPTYEAVCSGTTGHAEAVMVPFDSTKITYEELLVVFFGSHDPSTLNQQGNDRGTQYRSLIMANNAKQFTLANAKIEERKMKITSEATTTQLISLQRFYDAEEYHQNYERLNPDQPYVRAVSIPRLNQYKKAFPQFLK